VPEADGGRLRGGPSEGHASTASFERFEDLLDKLKTSQAQVLNKVAEASWAAEFLAQERVFLSAAGRRRFLCALVYELVAVNALLARRSLGDYSPDPRPARFPAWKPPAPNSGDVMSPMGLYKAWCTANEARTSNSTRARWITVFRDLERFWKGRDVRAFTEEDALLWQRETAQLVPWRPALEQFAGRHVQGIARGQSISWGLWRGRTPGLPPM
jgi:hypothetical protein